MAQQQDIYWQLLDDCIQRSGELALSEALLSPEKESVLEAWETIRKWREEGVPEAFHEALMACYSSQVYPLEQEAGIRVSQENQELHQAIQAGKKVLDYQKLLQHCIHSLGEHRVSYWSLIDRKDIHHWHHQAVPAGARETVIGLQEQVLSGLEQELKDDETKLSLPSNEAISPANPQKNPHTSRPKLQFYREAYANFYEDILIQDVRAIFEAEEEMAQSNLIIGQQIYRVRAILAVYGQRKFLEWLKGICCKICNISWRKAYDLMYAYEARRFVEQNQADLLPVFDFQIQRFQCEARRYKDNLIQILSDAKAERKRYTLEEVKEVFPPEKSKPPEEPHVSELRLSLRKLLDDSLIKDLSGYIQTHPGETFQSILEVALRNWLVQQA